ncbi:hypothetical protein Sgly_3199 [Syntrophobotulus glycolicus DSM 8271]|uniref:S-layer protein SbsC C-terminal domain-containing protein n=1 Tax=Syntrophobotulus glycolicus (strain DSM 8271 / FlGlyR) TaxID=645991 RepID=F0T1P1_SYNGF|nr:hypothetical protein [Syntrophobotulus glycolicus]ADY57465.1 hypothetical protein Sgly_3199 [Syntrophobotulus glycolicus DSM 8271]
MNSVRYIVKPWLKKSIVISLLIILINISMGGKVAEAATSTLAPGSVAGTTKVTLTPLVKGDTFRYVISNTALGSLPLVGETVPGGAVAYTSGEDISGIDETTNKYLDVYEVDGSGKVVAFKELTIAASNIAAPVLSATPVQAPGSKAKSVKLTLTPNNAGDTFKIQVVSKPGKLPGIGVKAGGKAYTSGGDITGVDTTSKKYIDIYEVDATGKVTAFTEITVTAESITAPDLKTSTLAPGSVAGTTKVTLTPLVKGDTFRYVISNAALGSLPLVGETVPGGAVAYTSGEDISGIDETTNKYLDVYEVDGSGKVVAFKELTIAASNIAAPVLSATPVQAPGSKAKSVKLTLTPNNAGDTFKIQVVSKPGKLPGIGVKAGGKAYTSGGDITGVDATSKKYIDIYEVDATGKVTAFTEITVDSNVITAPSL